MNEIQHISNISPANFSAINSKTPIQVTLIVKLLSDSIEFQKPITKDEILDTYIEWMKKVKKQFYDLYPNRKCTEQEFRNSSYNSLKALTWFKANLGNAIIRGKILAIPVIQI